MSNEDFVFTDEIIEEEVEYTFIKRTKTTRKRRHNCDDYRNKNGECTQCIRLMKKHQNKTKPYRPICPNHNTGRRDAKVYYLNKNGYCN